MNRIHYLFLLCGFSTSFSLCEASVHSDKLDSVQAQIKSIDQDSNLRIEVAWHHEGDGDFRYIVYRKADEIVKLTWSLFVGPEELHQTIYFPKRETPLHVFKQAIIHYDDGSHEISQDATYYDENKLLHAQARTFMYEGSIPDQAPSVEWEHYPEEVGDPQSEEDRAYIRQALRQVSAIDLVPAKKYTGQYVYAYDTESFKECGTDRRFQVENKLLREAYTQLKLEVFAPARIEIVATMEMQEDMAGEMVETLKLYEVLSMQADQECQ
ncbi:MAG: hypothetical protein AAF587_23740 [Bacteroidota bacterium]